MGEGGVDAFLFRVAFEGGWIVDRVACYVCGRAESGYCRGEERVADYDAVGWEGGFGCPAGWWVLVRVGGQKLVCSDWLELNVP